MSGRGTRVLHKTVSVVVTTVMIGACVLATLMVLPTLLGYERYVIISGSMEPTIPKGSIVYDEVVPLEELVVGDIITFVPPPEYDIEDPVTHRVVQITKDADPETDEAYLAFRTKGDNNDDIDPWRMVLDGPDQARVAHHIPYVGYFYMALQVRGVQVLVIVIPSVLLIGYILITLWRASGDGVKQQRAAAEATTEAAAEAAAGEHDEVGS